MRNITHVSDDARTVAMIESYRSGCSLQQVGDQFGLTRELVRQVLKQAGEPTRSSAVCPVDGCEARYYQHRGAYCQAHRYRAAKFGDPLGKPAFKRDICGTVASYNSRCRCVECRRANSSRAAREREKRQGVPPTHGDSGYTNYGCRCAECTAAHTLRLQKYRARVRAERKKHPH